MFRQQISGEINSFQLSDLEQTVFPYFGSIVSFFQDFFKEKFKSNKLRFLFEKLIRNQETLLTKNNPSSLFAYFHKVTHEFVVNLKLLQQYKQDKLRFITKFQFSPNEEDQTYIDILQNPISVQNNIIVFLITVNWAYSSSKQPNDVRQNNVINITTNTTKINQKIKNQSYFKSQQNISSKTRIENCKIQMVLFIYAISDTIFLQKNHSQVILSIIAENGGSSYKQYNKLYVFSKTNFDKNSQYRVSTAADTKGYDLKRISFQSQKNQSQQSDFRLSKIISPKNSSSQQKFFHSSLITPQSLKSKQRKDNKLARLFRKIEILQLQSHLQHQKIISLLQKNKNSQNFKKMGFILFETIEKWFCQKSAINWQIEEFYLMNQENILNCKVQKLISQYKLLVQLQFKNITTKSITQIKNQITRLSNQIIQSYFRDTESFLNQNSQNKYYQKLLSEINKEQSNLLKTLGQMKQESVNRKINVIQDPNYATKTNKSSFLFQNLVGDQEINNLQIGYQIYKQTLNQKMTQIFDELSSSQPKYIKQKMEITTQKDFIQNLQRRINIYQEKKRILQQTLFLDKKQQENLQQYLKGLQKKQNNMDQIVSEKEQFQIE